MLAFLRLLAWSFMTAVMVVAGLGTAGYWLYHDAQRPGPLAAARTVVIPPHTGIDGIAGLLAGNGVIRHPLSFEALARISGRRAELKAGEYEFPPAVSEMAALDIIASGRTVKHRLTIPEGLTSAQVLALVRAAPALVGDTGPPPPEGSVLPDTYVYSYGETRKALLERMQRDMTQFVARLWRGRRKDLPLATPEQAVILASIVEKETALAAERAHIAGVYLNRLRLGMPLQADPTVLFAVDHDGATPPVRPLTHADLATQSPYNTYLVKGLPPGPIDNPGRASLLAALEPERTEDLYFVADGSGGHVFAKTLAGQNRDVAQYRRTEAAGTDPQPSAAPAAAEPAKTSAARRQPLRHAVHAVRAAPRHHAERHRAERHDERPPRCRRRPGHPCRR